jgi:gamma-glutamyltranspeptidase/glutathione hydrolase
LIITTVLQTLLERLELGKSLPDAIAAPRASQRNGATSIAEPAFMTTEAPALTARHGHAFGTPQAEIGATTGIEFFDRGKMLAAAEPVRRGGGSALVVKPQR